VISLSSFYLLFSVFSFRILIQGVQAGRAIPAKIELRVGSVLGLFDELPFEELPPPLVAGPLNVSLQFP
jgi:hypothetical protein